MKPAARVFAPAPAEALERLQVGPPCRVFWIVAVAAGGRGPWELAGWAQMGWELITPEPEECGGCEKPWGHQGKRPAEGPCEGRITPTPPRVTDPCPPPPVVILGCSQWLLGLEASLASRPGTVPPGAPARLAVFAAAPSRPRPLPSRRLLKGRFVWETPATCTGAGSPLGGHV